MFNIGGISNILVFGFKLEIIGYDVSVGNVLMDSWIEKYFGKCYDKNVEWVKMGEVIFEFLVEMLNELFL